MSEWFTMDNYEGCTQDELNLLNTVWEELLNEWEADPEDRDYEQDQKNAGDWVSNSYCEGMTLDELRKAVQRRGELSRKVFGA